MLLWGEYKVRVKTIDERSVSFKLYVTKPALIT